MDTEKELVLENGSVVHFSPAANGEVRGASEDHIKIAYDSKFIQLWNKYHFEYDE